MTLDDVTRKVEDDGAFQRHESGSTTLRVAYYSASSLSVGKVSRIAAASSTKWVGATSMSFVENAEGFDQRVRERCQVGGCDQERLSRSEPRARLHKGQAGSV
jgi:hypothetical protein